MFVPVPSPEEMRRWDATALNRGIPEMVLMENAAREAFAVIQKRVGDVSGKHVAILAGGGNNGGDGICLARHLADAGALPYLCLSREINDYEGSPARWLRIALGQGIPCRTLPEEMDVHDARTCLQAVGTAWETIPYVLVDGLLGTGFSGLLRERERALVHAVNSFKGQAFILALDVPSGLNALAGTPQPEAVRADATITFQAPKPGLILPQARPWCGDILVRPIGLPTAVQMEHPASWRMWLDTPYGDVRGYGIPPLLPSSNAGATPRPAPAHKGEAGRVTVIGGSAGMTGAPRLAALGAMRGGAGLVCVAAPPWVIAHLSVAHPELLTISLPPDEENPASSQGSTPSVKNGKEWPGHLSNRLLETLSRSQAVVIGPGMGRGNGAGHFLEALLSLEKRPPVVLDADALYALRGRAFLLDKLRENDILTPHPGEAAALLGCDAAAVQADRPAALRALADRASAVWVLKGAGTLIAAPGKPITISPFAVSTLAVGGSGDVLAGLMGTLLAQGRPADEAAALAVHRHALAGLRLAALCPHRGNTPQEIAHALAFLPTGCFPPEGCS